MTKLIRGMLILLFICISEFGFSDDGLTPFINNPWILQNSKLNPIRSVSVESYDDQYVTYRVVFENSRISGFNDYMVELTITSNELVNEKIKTVTVARAVNSNFEITTPRLEKTISSAITILSRSFSDSSNEILLGESEYKVCPAIC